MSIGVIEAIKESVNALFASVEGNCGSVNNIYMRLEALEKMMRDGKKQATHPYDEREANQGETETTGEEV